MYAEKMFNKLGFAKKTEDDNKLVYERSDGFEVTVVFNLHFHSYCVCEDDPMNDSIAPASVTVAVHEAITKQLEELGWL